jgi:hypothetical protein
VSCFLGQSLLVGGISGKGDVARQDRNLVSIALPQVIAGAAAQGDSKGIKVMTSSHF